MLLAIQIIAIHKTYNTIILYITLFNKFWMIECYG